MDPEKIPVDSSSSDSASLTWTPEEERKLVSKIGELPASSIEGVQAHFLRLASVAGCAYLTASLHPYFYDPSGHHSVSGQFHRPHQW